MIMEEAAAKNLADPIVMLIASLAYCYLLGANITKGILRLLFLLPVFYLFALLPWFSSSRLLRGIISFFITWIASFKLLLFCFHHGPLLACKNYVDFVAVTVFPIKVKENIVTCSNPSTLLKALANLVGVLLLMLNFYNHKVKYPSWSTTLVHGLFMICGFFMVFTCGATLARYEMVPLFNKPYLATSLQDFWGRRWNRLSSNILRQTIYEPTRNAVKDVVGVGPAKVVARISTLIVSGIMHEAMFYYITCGKRPTWEVTWFFVLHGMCMIFEAALKNLVRAKGWSSVHPAVSVAFTIGFVLVTFYWLLFLPVWRSAQDECAGFGRTKGHYQRGN